MEKNKGARKFTKKLRSIIAGAQLLNYILARDVKTSQLWDLLLPI